MKLACVVHRFGAEIAGGSEGHCRAIAERLAARHDVTVLTTCARDHITWRNEFPEGPVRVGSLVVRRFPVERPRSLHRFAEISERVFGGDAPRELQDEWFRANGPETPSLIEFLRTRSSEYDRVLFWSFRYFQTYFGLPHVADRAVLVPTAEEDPVMRFDVLERFFALPAGFLFLTPEERALVARRVPQTLAPSEIIGGGLDPAGPMPSARPSLEALGVTPPFVLYLGRVDPNKGCETLVRHFVEYHSSAPRSVQLVLAGPVNMPMTTHPAIKVLGFVDEARRATLLSTAAALVVPSRYESLSLALLEAWNHRLPALVNAHCAVLKGQALRSNGALFYRDSGEFAAGLNYLIANPVAARRMGEQGLAYVEREYRWPAVMAKIERFLASLE